MENYICTNETFICTIQIFLFIIVLMFYLFHGKLLKLINYFRVVRRVI